jgi:hypothetical protein
MLTGCGQRVNLPFGLPLYTLILLWGAYMSWVPVQAPIHQLATPWIGATFGRLQNRISLDLLDLHRNCLEKYSTII